MRKSSTHITTLPPGRSRPDIWSAARKPGRAFPIHWYLDSMSGDGGRGNGDLYAGDGGRGEGDLYAGDGGRGNGDAFLGDGRSGSRNVDSGDGRSGDGNAFWGDGRSGSSHEGLPTFFVPPRLVVPRPGDAEPGHTGSGIAGPESGDSNTFSNTFSNRRWMFWRRSAVGLAVVLLAVGAWSVYQIREAALSLPPIPERPAALLPAESVVLASDRSQLGRIYSERRRWVSLQEMAPQVVQALIAIEDHRYYEHGGVDYRRFFGAARAALDGRSEGASTIPMQLARNYFPELSESGRYKRKVQEVLMARRLSAKFDKDRILEWYLNTVPFGHNSFGIEAAAERYFTTHAIDLNLAQASLLVGMLKGSTRYDPFDHPQDALERRNLVLTRMVQTGTISEEIARNVQRQPLGLEPSIIDPATSIAPHFMDQVRRQVEEWAQKEGFDALRDGLTIHTSLDPTLQTLAQTAVDRQMALLQNVVDRQFGAPGSRAYERFWLANRDIETDAIRRSEAFRRRVAGDRSAVGNSATRASTGTVSAAGTNTGGTYEEGLSTEGMSAEAAIRSIRRDQSLLDDIRRRTLTLEAGLVAIEPGTGLVRAWIGGRDYRADQFDKVASARRQPGSTFKPFVFTAAIDAGFSPYYMVEDRLRTFTDARGTSWTPTNSGGGVSGQLYTLRQGLAWSKNTVAIHLTDRLGPQRVAETAQLMGIESPLLPVPSLALGTSEVSLLELVSAYVTLADEGVRHRPVLITRIEDRWGRTVATFDDGAERVLSAQTSHTMVDMLRGVIDAGTGSAVRGSFGVKGDLAGKTGTTQNNADGWFMLMHSELVSGAWVGFNDPRLAFESNYWGQGGHNALRLVGDFYAKATKGTDPILGTSRFRAPPGYITPPVPQPRITDESPIVPALPHRVTPLGATPAARQRAIPNQPPPNQ